VKRRWVPGIGIGWPPVPRAAGVAVPDPQIVQGRADGMVVALFGAEQAEPAASPQQPGGLAERDLGVDPVERGARNDQVEGAIGGVQVLERGDLERDLGPAQTPTGGGDHGRADVDGGYPEPVARQPLGELAGPAADLQDCGAGGEGGGRGHEFRDARRIAGARLLVPFGNAIEQRPLVTSFVPVPLGFSADGHRPDAIRQGRVGARHRSGAGRGRAVGWTRKSSKYRPAQAIEAERVRVHALGPVTARAG